MFSKILTMPFINLFANSYNNANRSPLAEKLEKARQAIADADYIIIGAGSGLSTPAGLSYDGDDFRREFKPWIEKLPALSNISAFRRSSTLTC